MNAFPIPRQRMALVSICVGLFCLSFHSRQMATCSVQGARTSMRELETLGRSRNPSFVPGRGMIRAHINARFVLRGGGGALPVLRRRGEMKSKQEDREGQNEIKGRHENSQARSEEAMGDEGAELHGGLPTLSAQNGEVLEIQSLCMNCGAQGVTRVMPTTIPRFGQVVIMSFECAECNYTNKEVQNAAEIKPFGVQYILNVATRDDLDRQVIKSRHATIRLPHLDFEIPPVTQAGSLSTVEGVLTHAAKSLEYMQAQRRAVDEAMAAKIQVVIDDLRDLASGSQPFVMTLDDPTGQSIIESTAFGPKDFALTKHGYTRSVEQDAALGVAKAHSTEEHKDEVGNAKRAPCASSDAPGEGGAYEGGKHAQGAVGTRAAREGHYSSLGGGGVRWVADKAVDFGQRRLGEMSHGKGQGDVLAALGDLAPLVPEEVQVFKLPCPACRAAEEEERMFATAIPHFGEVLLRLGLGLVSG
jgi:ZPR1 zinc finger protein